MPRRRVVRWFAWVCGGIVGLCLVGVVCFMAGFVLLSHIVHPREVVVPSVYGMTEAEAIKTLVRAGLTVHPDIEQQESEVLEEGLVLQQSPRPNILAREGRRVRLTVSKGAKRIMIPNLVGVEERAIESSLEHLDLHVGHRAAVYHETAAPGVIIAQNPPPGEALVYGKSVSILVSMGRRPTAYVMPDRIGTPIEDAQREFSEAGFSVVIDRQEVSSPDDWGRVLDQNPPPGGKLLEGGEVVFTVGVRELQAERVQRITIPVPRSASGKFVTVAVYEISGGKPGDPETFRVPVDGSGNDLQLSIPFAGKLMVEVYDGAVEGGALLYKRTFEPSVGSPGEQ